MNEAPAPFPFADRVRAVLFDAGNTLIWLDHARMADLAAAAGADVGTERVRVAEMRARPLLDPWLRTVSKREGADTSRRYAETIAAELGLDPRARPGADVVAAFLGAWGGLWIVPPADAPVVLDDLAARGFRVGCVSNSAGNVRSLLDRAGLASRLACVVDSGLVGVEKPDPRIFRIGCEALGAASAETVYVGDFLSLDVLGARGAGLEGVLLDPIGAWGEGLDVPREIQREPAGTDRDRPGPTSLVHGPREKRSPPGTGEFRWSGTPVPRVASLSEFADRLGRR